MLSNLDFVETKLATKFGDFNIRVYADDPKKETVVLWTSNLNTSLPVLVRVHSECITGDMMGSLHCDCGKQLHKSLELIRQQGGVLIYLRQEGRGIGLFEKIKTYQLQSKGHDTFEANVLLGHQPDQRSYEMVKTVLSDLNISSIQLLTNNPSKVSEIAKLGIKVVNHIPLLTKPNKHNQFYLSTKKQKFQHFQLHSKHYFYGVPATTPEQIHAIGNFIKDKNCDPSLTISIGITANHFMVTNINERKQIQLLFEACLHYPELIPVLHFSFTNSEDILKDLQQIKTDLPFVQKLQLNDLPTADITNIKCASKLFSLYIPLSNENFHLIHEPSFRKIITNTKAALLIDDSKGKGIQGSFESYQQKINTLLEYGFNNIAVCGGFGPNALEQYFALKRYYRINLSIDAESKLKSEGIIDLEKIKLYLLQLIRFDDPKTIGITQTRKFLEQCRRSTWDTLLVEGNTFSIHPQVFHPGHFPSSMWFASKLKNLLKDCNTFCEIGCGSGIISCLIAKNNPNIHISSTDINPYACENTQLNAKSLNLEKQIKTFTGDVLDSIPANRTFNAIFWALPFGFLDPGTTVTLEEQQVFDPGYKSIHKLFQTAKERLKSNGSLFLGFSSDLGHEFLLKSMAKEFNLKIEVIETTYLKEDEDVDFKILKCSFC